MKLLILVGLFTVTLTGCRSPEPRGPIINKSDQFLKESVVRNRELQHREEAEITQILEKDTLHHYSISAKGFWYRIDRKNKKDTLTPKFGDLVRFTYAIHTINGEELYSKKEIGNREYYMDKENLFTGLREGLKLMGTKEQFTFYFPSSVAFGYYGDQGKIGRNMPLRVTAWVDTVIPQPLKTEPNN